MVLAVNFIGDGLRDAIDPTSREGAVSRHARCGVDRRPAGRAGARWLLAAGLVLALVAACAAERPARLHRQPPPGAGASGAAAAQRRRARTPRASCPASRPSRRTAGRSRSSASAPASRDDVRPAGRLTRRWPSRLRVEPVSCPFVTLVRRQGQQSVRHRSSTRRTQAQRTCAGGHVLRATSPPNPELRLDGRRSRPADRRDRRGRVAADGRLPRGGGPRSRRPRPTSTGVSTSGDDRGAVRRSSFAKWQATVCSGCVGRRSARERRVRRSRRSRGCRAAREASSGCGSGSRTAGWPGSGCRP